MERRAILAGMTATVFGSSIAYMHKQRFWF